MEDDTELRPLNPETRFEELFDKITSITQDLSHAHSSLTCMCHNQVTKLTRSRDQAQENVGELIKANINLTRILEEIKASAERDASSLRAELHSAKDRCVNYEGVITDLRKRNERLQNKYDELHDKYDKLTEYVERLAEKSLDKRGGTIRSDIKING